ncbi:hypothetical protein DUNSADRAFT_6334 [Dunaliella salina]|uniref:Uncharacterized protein n=1 Tax=Dunaliella salina TaxID=3046 RepID=A0ABQ7GNH7_DUNSA|nr:hypothetical protein DUNSADRAFT_6334 [Dunaliella salina]|eukprot:KAF5836131.1 hypothetical protein DUNSADRAFT_6334 [Dunaliella salina]
MHFVFSWHLGGGLLGARRRLRMEGGSERSGAYIKSYIKSVVSDLGNEVQQVASVLLPILDKMAKRVVVAELELIRGHQTKLNQLTMRLLAVRKILQLVLCVFQYSKLDWGTTIPSGNATLRTSAAWLQCVISASGQSVLARQFLVMTPIVSLCMPIASWGSGTCNQARFNTCSSQNTIIRMFNWVAGEHLMDIPLYGGVIFKLMPLPDSRLLVQRFLDFM